MNTRASGRTTRLVDSYIQKLFTERTTGVIKDHHDSVDCNNRLANYICRRLDAEHPHVKYCSPRGSTDRQIILLEDPVSDNIDGVKFYKCNRDTNTSYIAVLNNKSLEVTMYSDGPYAGTIDFSEYDYDIHTNEMYRCNKEVFEKVFKKAINAFKLNYNL